MADSRLDLLRDFAGDTTAHGIGRISSSKAVWLKLVWVAAFFGGLAVFIWQMTSLIQKYNDYPITTKTKVPLEF